MPRLANWRDLRIGLAALATVAILTYVILVYGRIGRLSGDTFHAFIRTEEARGIIKGSEVWLSGQKVGAVRDIEFLPPSGADDHRLLLDVELMERHRAAIRRDADVQIRSGGSLIGAPVVYIVGGTGRVPAIGDGDTIAVSQQVDVEMLGDRLDAATKHLPAIMGDVRAILAVTRDPEGSAGAFMTEGAGSAMQAAARAGALATRLRDGRGTLGRAMGGDGVLIARAQTAMARADSVRQLLASDATSLGRFRRDSSLTQAVADIRDELSIVGALLDEPRGTAGRVVQDSAIVAGVGEIRAEMTALFADLKARPFRYLGF